MNALFRSPGSIGAKSAEAVDYFFRMLSDDELLPMVRVGVEFLSEAIKSERIQERQDHRCEAIRQFYHWLLNDARQSREIREDVDVEAATELMMALNEGILMLSAAGLRRVPLERLQAAYTALLDNGLASPTGSMFATSTSPSTATLPPRPTATIREVPSREFRASFETPAGRRRGRQHLAPRRLRRRAPGGDSRRLRRSPSPRLRPRPWRPRSHSAATSNRACRTAATSARANR